MVYINVRELDYSYIIIHREEDMEAKMSVGQFVFMLHSHLPYYRKAGMWPFGEENLYECMAETKGLKQNLLSVLLRY